MEPNQAPLPTGKAGKQAAKDKLRGLMASSKRRELWDNISKISKQRVKAAKLSETTKEALAQMEVPEHTAKPAAPELLPEPAPTATEPAPMPTPAKKAKLSKQTTPEKLAEQLVASTELSDTATYVVDIEHLENKLQYGKLYRVLSTDAEGVSKVVSATGLPTPLSVPQRLLRDVAGLKLPTSVITAMHLSKESKRMFLEESDFGDPLYKNDVEAVGKLTPEELSYDHVMLGMTQLRNSWRSLRSHALWPEPLAAHLERLIHKPQLSQQEADVHKRYTVFLSKLVSHVDLVLAPIHTQDHFTLLSITRGEAGAVSVRYFDTLHDAKPACWDMALMLCTAMKIDMPKLRTNVSKQPGATCACQILHYCEHELRRAAGEQMSFGRWPDQTRVSMLRVRLGKWVSSLGNELKKWNKEELEIRDKLIERHAMFKSKIDELAKAGQLSDAARADAELYAKKMYNPMDNVVSVFDPPEDWAKAFELLQQVRVERKLELLALRQAEKKAAEDPVSAAMASLDELAAPPTVSVAEPPKEPEPDSDWRLDLLPPERRAIVDHIFKQGVGVCSRCRYSHGCLSCDGEKALRYHLGKAGYIGPAVWHC